MEGEDLIFEDLRAAAVEQRVLDRLEDSLGRAAEVADSSREVLRVRAIAVSMETVYPLPGDLAHRVLPRREEHGRTDTTRYSYPYPALSNGMSTVS